jgi:hypothetical protein
MTVGVEYVGAVARQCRPGPVNPRRSSSSPPPPGHHRVGTASCTWSACPGPLRRTADCMITFPVTAGLAYRTSCGGGAMAVRQLRAMGLDHAAARCLPNVDEDHATGGDYTLDHGHTVPIGRPWVRGSRCDRLLVRLPYPWGTGTGDRHRPRRSRELNPLLPRLGPTACARIGDRIATLASCMPLTGPAIAPPRSPLLVSGFETGCFRWSRGAR